MELKRNMKNVSEEQISYANILNISGWIGLSILIITFIIYILGILPCFIPIEALPKYWSMKAKDYIHTVNAPKGWDWIAMIGKGDYLNFIGIAILAASTILSQLRILPILMKKKDTPYVIIVILQVAVLVLAASGILRR